MMQFCCPLKSKSRLWIYFYSFPIHYDEVFPSLFVPPPHPLLDNRKSANLRRQK
jgi:hypothetical protein